MKTLNGSRRNFDFEPTNTILQVKEALQEKEGINAAQLRLIFNGKQMSDENTLAHYNVVAGSSLHMVLQLRGGQ